VLSHCASRISGRAHDAGVRSVVFLDEEKRLVPGPNHPGENHEEEPIGLQLDGVFDLSTKDDQLVP